MGEVSALLVMWNVVERRRHDAIVGLSQKPKKQDPVEIVDYNSSNEDAQRVTCNQY